MMIYPVVGFGAMVGDKGRATSLALVMILSVIGSGLALAGGATAQQGTNIVVAADGSGQYENIQTAVDAADPGDTIQVKPGDYRGNVDVDTENVALVGPNADTPGFGERDEEAVILGRVVLSGDGTSLSGFTVSPATDGGEEAWYIAEAVRVSNSPDHVVVENNIVRDYDAHEDLGPWQGVEGIAVYGTDAGSPVTDVTIVGNEIYNIQREEGEGYGGAAGVMVQGNVSGVLIEDNHIHDIGMGESPWAQGVVITSSGNQDGTPENVDILRNDIFDVISDPSTPLYGVGVGVEATEGNVEVHHSNIYDNEIGMESKVDITVDATKNYWGAPNGPEREAGKSGRTVGDGNPVITHAEGDIHYKPWHGHKFDKTPVKKGHP